MTERLYYDNAYLTEFDGVVEKVSVRNGKRIAAMEPNTFSNGRDRSLTKIVRAWI